MTGRSERPAFVVKTMETDAEKNGFAFTGGRLEQTVTGGTLVELEVVRPEETEHG